MTETTVQIDMIERTVSPDRRADLAESHAGDQAILRPLLHHVNLKTIHLRELIEWYATVVGMTPNHQFEGGAWLTNDAAKYPGALVERSSFRDRVADAIVALPEREKMVIALYYCENLTLRKSGEILRVTESRVWQLRTKAVLRLRSKLVGELE